MYGESTLSLNRGRKMVKGRENERERPTERQTGTEKQQNERYRRTHTRRARQKEVFQNKSPPPSPP